MDACKGIIPAQRSAHNWLIGGSWCKAPPSQHRIKCFSRFTWLSIYRMVVIFTSILYYTCVWNWQPVSILGCACAYTKRLSIIIMWVCRTQRPQVTKTNNISEAQGYAKSACSLCKKGGKARHFQYLHKSNIV